jgi:hypothetical protein
MSYPWNPNDTLTAADLNAAIGMASGTGGAGSDNVGRNLIHNGLFTISQRGVGAWSTNGIYTFDRWQLDVSGGTLQIAEAAANDANRVQIGDEAVRFFLNATTTGGGGATDYAQVSQPIEDVRRLAGKTVTVSFYANSSLASPKIGVVFLQNFGTGGSPSAGVATLGQSVTLSSSAGTFARYSLTFAIPSVAGKTLGTNNNDCTTMAFWFSAGSSNATGSGGVPVQAGVFNLWGVQCEVGTVATPLEKLDPVLQLQQCQRFFCTSSLLLNTYDLAGSAGAIWIPFPTPMRAPPATVTPTFTTQTNTVGSVVGISALGFQLFSTLIATGNSSLIGSFTASADL